MPTFEFTAPDSKIYQVDGPEGATPEQAFQILQTQIGRQAPASVQPAASGAVIPGTPPQVAPPPTPNTDTWSQRLASPVDAALTLAWGLPTSIVGMATEAVRGPEAGRSVMEAMSRQPQTQTGARMVEGVGDFLRKSGLEALPGISGELAVLGRASQPAIRAVGDYARAAKLPDFTIPGKGFIDKASGKTSNAAAEAAKQKFGDVAFQAGERATHEAYEGTGAAFRQAQDARIAQLAHEEATAAQTAAAERAGQDLLTKGVAAPKTAEQVGTTLRDTLGSRMNQLFEARAKEAGELYDRTVQAGRAKEAAGIPFATSPQGQAALGELKAMRETARGTNPLLPQEASTLDSLINVIEGDAKRAAPTPLGSGRVSSRLMTTLESTAAKPAGVEALMKQLRLVRKYNEEASPAEGVSALPKQFAQQIERILEPKLYGETGWLPEGGAADAAYKLASRKLDVFGTEATRRAMRGEKFDFKELAASPSEFGGRFFKDGQTIRQLKAAIGDSEMVKSSATEWAASQLRPMKAAAAREWAIKHTDVLREAGIEQTVGKYVADLQAHETNAALMARQAESRTAELSMAKQEAKALPQQIEAKRVAATDRINTFKTELQNAQPKEVAGKVKQLGSDLLKDGHITQEEYGQMLRDSNELQKHFNDRARAQKILLRIGGALGVGTALALGFPVIGHAAEGTSEFTDAEKERQYQEWKSRQKGKQ